MHNTITSKSMHHLFNEEEDINEFINELYAIYNYSNDGFYVVNSSGVTVRANPAFEIITGIKAEEIVGKHMADLVKMGVFDQSVALDVIKCKQSKTIIQKTRNGKITLVTGNPVFNENNDVVRVVSNIRDITELSHLYDELFQSKQLLNSYFNLIKDLDLNVENLEIIAESPAMRDIIELASRLAQVETNILLLGESGVGKSVIAEMLHSLSPRKKEPLITVNCSAIPDNLLESELFGYISGAFTGANKTGKKGILEEADKGTVFLDEIGELPLNLQPKILRFLENKEITKVGSTVAIKVDVRLISATNRDLTKMVATGQFREDLFYRLNVIPINIPPLRERREDIIPMTIKFKDYFNKKYGYDRTISLSVLDLFQIYDWPGNVREFKNLMERLVVLSRFDIITTEDLPQEILKFKKMMSVDSTAQIPFPISLPEYIKEIEKSVIKQAINTAGSIRLAAKLMGVAPSTVVRKMR